MQDFETFKKDTLNYLAFTIGEAHYLGVMLEHYRDILEDADNFGVWNRLAPQIENMLEELKYVTLKGR